MLCCVVVLMLLRALYCVVFSFFVVFCLLCLNMLFSGGVACLCLVVFVFQFVNVCVCACGVM